MIEYLNAEKPEILALLETKITQKVADQFKFLHEDYLNFNIFEGKRAYAGVTLLISKKFIEALPKFVLDITDIGLRIIHNHEKFVIFEGLGHAELDKEKRILSLFTSQFILVSCYSLNAGRGLVRLETRIKEWDTALYAYLNKLDKLYSIPVILAGDLNIAHTEMDIWNSEGNKRSSGHTKEERESFGSFLENSNYIDLWRHQNPNVRRYTYWSTMNSKMRKTNLGWRIDLFVATKLMLKHKIFCTIRDALPGSDHVPIVLEMAENGK